MKGIVGGRPVGSLPSRIESRSLAVPEKNISARAPSTDTTIVLDAGGGNRDRWGVIPLTTGDRYQIPKIDKVPKRWNTKAATQYKMTTLRGFMKTYYN
jgi:hypothetical protein